jgi:hypothetical protein
MTPDKSTKQGPPEKKPAQPGHEERQGPPEPKPSPEKVPTPAEGPPEPKPEE